MIQEALLQDIPGPFELEVGKVLPVVLLDLLCLMHDQPFHNDISV